MEATLENGIGEMTATLTAKRLMLDGDIIIESKACINQTAESVFLKDNVFLFVMEGQCILNYGKFEYQICKGEMVLLQNSILVDYQNKTDKLEMLSFSIKDYFLKEFIRMTRFKPKAAMAASPVVVHQIPREMNVFISSIEDYLNRPDMAENYLLRLKVFELLHLLAKADPDFLQQLMLHKMQARPDITVTVESNLMNSLTVNDLAQLSGRSLSSFKRDFYAIYNMPPSQWIREKRLSKAKELVAGSSMPIKDICYMLGFESNAHFSRLFKSYFGYRPSDLKLRYC
jgi:AraC-like DNA-binding protein